MNWDNIVGGLMNMGQTAVENLTANNLDRTGAGITPGVTSTPVVTSQPRASSLIDGVDNSVLLIGGAALAVLLVVIARK